MLLSIIIPYYNADAWIGKMLDSLLEQDIAQDDYEIIVVDDSSTQEPVVLRDYVARFPHIHYYRIAHCGMGPVRNYGMSLAKGDWIYFCDADDFLQPHVLRGIIAAAEERDLEMILANHVKINENDPIPTPRRNFDKLSDTMTGLQYFAKPTNKFSWGVWAYVTRRSVYESNGLAFEDVCFVEDRLFKFALMKVVTRCATIDVDLYYYVQHESSIFHAKRKQNNQEFIDVFYRYIEQLTALAEKPDLAPELLEVLDRRRHSTAFLLLSNAFVYNSVEVDAATLSRLESLGLYPMKFFPGRDPRRTRIIKWLMNHRRLWLLLHRVFHLLPERYIHKRFQI